ncbi:unnamed protein product [Diatraea saccharalis]|uniref:chitinase n=1 Tax=Diatraea saccharalis TaxID=40085 RepID=A0A9N9R9L7_9NEOP|nr:unnamed protein product [Diatraea saccharalis]
MYAFAGINTQGIVVSLDPHLDFPENKDNFRKFNDLKKKNPKLKTLLAVGGWNEGSSKYSIMAASPVLRKNFVQSALKTILDYGFDGLDIDWEYPNRRDTVHGKADVDHFTKLLKEIKEEFLKYSLILTAAVSAHKKTASLSYDVQSISKHLDYINLMTYDMYGAWDPLTGHNAPLHKGEGDNGVDRDALFTVDVAVEYWLKSGCPPEKLVLGVPFYGRTFTLKSTNHNGVRAPVTGAGINGPFTVTSGFIGYNEFCSKLHTESWTRRRDNLAKVPYAFRDLHWVSYDDPQSIIDKVEYAYNLNLAGIMIWSIETDDFNDICGRGKFPLLTAINDAMYRYTGVSTTTPSSKPTNYPETTSASTTLALTTTTTGKCL